ncbi:MAG: NAD-dependent succinate-semialdehyde dehydrogenase [Hyphomicrobium sp.]
MNICSKELTTAAFIGGQWITSPNTFPVIDPATGHQIAHVPNLTAQEARHAIDCASSAFPSWSSKTAKERAIILRRWFELIIKETNMLADLMTSEQGKPLSEAVSEVSYGASFVEWFAEEGKRAYGRTIPTTVSSRRYLTIKQPIGVVAAITPWNFPIAMITRKVASALSAGCTIIVKPSEDTPLCALALAKLGQLAGIPDGVLNILTTHDPSPISEIMCDDPRVRKLTFTGSTEVGKILYNKSAKTLKKLTLELGGNAPVIVFDDADIPKAVEGTLLSKFRNAGQTCVCANRILVHKNIYDHFATALCEAVKKLNVGPGKQNGVHIGPLINEQAINKIERLISDSRKRGAVVMTGGAKDQAGDLFYKPTVLTHVTPHMQIVNEEIFGPIAPLISFDTDEEAISIANQTPYGLAAYLFTQNVSRAWKTAERLESGIISINEGVFSNEVVPFGGVKQSGLGREGGLEGLDEYLETKFICLGGL